MAFSLLSENECLNEGCMPCFYKSVEIVSAACVAYSGGYIKKKKTTLVLNSFHACEGGIIWMIQFKLL